MAKRRKLRVGRLLILIGVLLLMIGIAAGIYYKLGLGAVSDSKTEQVISVEDGDTVTAVINKMDQAGLVKDKLCAKVYVKLHRPVLKKNGYMLNGSMTFPEMMKIMEDAPTKYIVRTKLTIPEGTTIPDLAKLVAKACNTTPENVLRRWNNKNYLKKVSKDYWFMDYDTMMNKDILYPLEGYLYPETYYIFEENPKVDTVTRTMLTEMGKNLEVYKSDIEKMSYTVHEFLTLASIVEKETLFEKDMPKIAGVFINRLNANMPLQSDITVNYALQRTGVDVSRKQTKTDSKYNTYKYPGLPVGPVASVQLKVMDALVNYTNHDYYYFFACKDGTVIYSKTYKQHLKVKEENKWY